MADTEKQRERPLWVKLVLLGASTRATAWACCLLSLAMAAAAIAYGFVDRRFFLGGIMALGALGYYLAIRWVDRHGTWSRDG